MRQKILIIKDNISYFIYAVTLIGILFPIPSLAQNKSNDAAILSTLRRQYEVLDSLIFPSFTGSMEDNKGTLSLLNKDFAPTEISSETDSALNVLTQARREAAMSKTGLEFSGQAYYRLDGALGIDEDDQVSPYDGKIQAELRWNYFSSSLYNRAGKLEELALQQVIDEGKLHKDDVDVLMEEQRRLLDTRYDEAMQALLNIRNSTLQVLEKAYLHLVNTEAMPSDALMEIELQAAEVQRLMAASGSTRATMMLLPETLTAPKVHYLYVDSTALMKTIAQSHFEIRQMDAQRQLLLKKADNTRYWNDVQVTPFARYSYYFRDTKSNSSNVDVGVALRFPISNEAAKKRKQLKAEADILLYQLNNTREAVTTSARHTVEQLIRTNAKVEGERQRIITMQKYIENRTKAYKSNPESYSLMARGREYNKYLECWQQYINFCHDRDVLLTQLQQLLPGISVMRYIKEVNL